MQKTASGKFVVRLPPVIHEALRAEAASRGISLNTVCQKALEDHVARKQASAPKSKEESPVVSGIRELLGDSLIGIVLFGSMARGESREGSDIDLLIVLNRDRTLGRKLYSMWDEQFGTTQQSPHFVHIPGTAADAGSLWMETAVEGVILYDRDGSISQFLGRIRRLIASGKLKRRFVYGHPYWVKAEGDIDNVQ
jgi:uncharacterized protein